MKFILTGLGNWAANRHLILKAAQEAERFGFWAVVLPDQYMWDPKDLGTETTDEIDSTLDTWTTLSFLVAKTWTIRLGTWVTPIPLRPPAILAKQVATLDILSEGRTILGIGAGVTQRMFEAYSQFEPPKARVDRTQEGIELILKLWHDSIVDHKGTYYTAKNAVLLPKPLQKPHPLLLFGGAGKRMLKLAGKYADICYIPDWNNMDPAEAKKTVLDAAQKHRREKQVSFAYGYIPLGPTDQYDIKEYDRRTREATKNGYDYFITAFPMTLPPWKVDKSNQWQVEKNYMTSLLEFSTKIIAPHNEQSAALSQKP